MVYGYMRKQISSRAPDRNTINRFRKNILTQEAGQNILRQLVVLLHARGLLSFEAAFIDGTKKDRSECEQVQFCLKERRPLECHSQKQWGRPCDQMPSFIIKRLPVRLTFDNNYFNALYQGIPIGGYTRLVENLLDGIEVRLGVDCLQHKAELDALAERVIYTGHIDAYCDYRLGALEYRCVRFEAELLDMPNFQGDAAVNYTDAETPYTRIIEHKWFTFGKDEQGNDLPKTVISREYSSEWHPGDEPYYPVNDEKNSALYAQYRALADREPQVIFGGRLGEYRYYDMDAVIASALDCATRELNR